MKRIFLFLASVAVFASCVKENTLAPELQDEQVRISAVAADSKALLDDLNVVWEETDAIALLLNGETKAEFEAESVNGANADFVGLLGVANEDLRTAYAVYPATAFNAELKVAHELPADQTSGVTSEMLLASAVLDVEDLKDAQSTATFNSALTLLQVVVPAGVKDVTLESSRDGLVGQTTFNFNSQTGLLSRASVSTPRTVKLAADAGLEAKTYPVLVYPGNAGDLKLTMTATDGAVYESTVQYVTFAAGEARKIDLTKIFNVDSHELYVVLPAGETFEVPVVTTDYHQYEVSCTADWVTYEVPTKGFHKETITFTVAQNTTGADREAEVTISWGDRTKSFTIQQKNIFMDFVSTDENPLEWEENFGVYANESDATPVNTYKNIFTIELSDNFSKGTYKVNNIFVYNDKYTGNVAGTYYANYVAGTFTIIKNDSGYPFSNNTVDLTYNEAEKTFTASSPIQFGYKFSANYLQNGGFIKGYTAAVKVEEEPEPEQPSEDPIAGTWTLTAGEMGTGSGFGDAPTSLVGKTMVISGSGGNYTIDTIGDEAYSLNVTFDGTILSVSMYGATLKFVYDSESKTLTQEGEFMNWMNPAIRNIVATKPGAIVKPEQPSVTVDSIVGDNWSQDWAANSGLSKTSKVSIKKVDDTHVSISQLFDHVTISSATFDPSAMTLTVPSGWSHPYGMPGDNPELVFNVSDDFNTLTLPGQYSIGGYMSVTDFTLTR